MNGKFSSIIIICLAMIVSSLFSPAATHAGVKTVNFALSGKRLKIPNLFPIFFNIIIIAHHDTLLFIKDQYKQNQ